MDTFNHDILSDDNKQLYKELMKRISKEGRINEGLEWPNKRGNYSNLSRCWESTTSLTSGGYGQFNHKKVNWNTHRCSYWLHNGQPEMKDRSMIVAHACDNPTCANPEHLSFITQIQNNLDSVKRIRAYVPPKPEIRTSIACNNCREHHKDCVGFPCSRCVKEEIECVKVESRIMPQAFKKGDKIGEKNNRCDHPSSKIYAIRERFMKGIKYGELKKWVDEYKMSYISIQAVTNRPGYRDEPDAKPPGWDEFLTNKKAGA